MKIMMAPINKPVYQLEIAPSYWPELAKLYVENFSAHFYFRVAYGFRYIE